MYNYIRPLVNKLFDLDAERDIRTLDDVHAYCRFHRIIRWLIYTTVGMLAYALYISLGN